MGRLSRLTRRISWCVAAAILSCDGGVAYEQPSGALKTCTQKAKEAYTNHDYDAACVQYQEAIKLAAFASPAVLIVLYSNLGAALREGHKYESAEQAFKTALTYAEKNRLEHSAAATNAMKQYALLLRRMHKNMDAELMEARASGQALVSTPPPATTAQITGADVMAPVLNARPDQSTPSVPGQTGKHSLDSLKRTVAEQPENYNAWTALTSEYAAEGNWQSVIQTELSIARKFPANDKNIHAKLAYAYYKNGDHQTAVSEAQTAISLDPDDPHNYLFLQQLYVEQGDVAAAVANGEMFLQKFPSDQAVPSITTAVKSLKAQQQMSGSAQKAMETRQNWPASYFPLKVYCSPVEDSYHFAPSKIGITEQSPAEVVTDACNAWVRASQQRISFQPANDAHEANVEVTFTNNPNGLEPGQLGVSQWSYREEHQKVRITILLVSPQTGKPLTPELIMSTTLHELGHALGLQHSAQPDDVMYPEMHGDPLVNLSDNDGQRVIRLYLRNSTF